MLAEAYLGIKHTHIMLAVFSIIFFNFRFWKYFLAQRPKWARIIPHVVDTFLLLTGILLAITLSINPFAAGGGWLAVKLLLMVLYIGFAVVAMKQNFVHSTRLLAYLISNFMAMGVVYMALIRPFIY